jgi:hypothetical protein
MWELPGSSRRQASAYRARGRSAMSGGIGAIPAWIAANDSGRGDPATPGPTCLLCAASRSQTTELESAPERYFLTSSGWNLQLMALKGTASPAPTVILPTAESGTLRENMEIKITVNVGPDTSYMATFHPAPQRDAERERFDSKVRPTPVRTGTSEVAPGLAIALPASEASLPV